jgi:hypothetical protein
MSFKALETDDFVVSADSITAGLWYGNEPTITSFITSSTQAAGSSGNYYLNVYSSSAFENIQFAITYGNLNGSGSQNYDDAVNGKSPSATIWGQYRSLVLGDENSNFSFGGITGSDIWVISVDRNRYKESLFPGSTTLVISGSGGIRYLTDNSTAVTTVEFNDAGRVFQLVSGSAGTINETNANGYSAGSGSYGWFLPDIATYILNPQALSSEISLTPARNSAISNTDDNNATLYDAIVGGGSFTANSQETITSDFIFVRPRSSEFNYSENPSFISGSTGEVIYDDFINNPQVYITTVGLYNDNSELLAVAKLSKPLLKDFTKEALVRVKLDF